MTEHAVPYELYSSAFAPSPAPILTYSLSKERTSQCLLVLNGSELLYQIKRRLRHAMYITTHSFRRFSEQQ